MIFPLYGQNGLCSRIYLLKDGLFCVRCLEGEPLVGKCEGMACIILS